VLHLIILTTRQRQVTAQPAKLYQSSQNKHASYSPLALLFLVIVPRISEKALATNLVPLIDINHPTREPDEQLDADHMTVSRVHTEARVCVQKGEVDAQSNCQRPARGG
jgi:hypothetical protein